MMEAHIDSLYEEVSKSVASACVLCSDAPISQFQLFKQARRAQRRVALPLPLKRLVILGSGFAGLEALAEAKLHLAKLGEAERKSWVITVIERRDEWVGGWANQYIVTGRKSAEECSKPLSKWRYGDIAQLVRDEIVSLDVEGRQVLCSQTGRHAFDHLIIALGIQPVASHLVKDKMHNICSLASGPLIAADLEAVKPGGSVLVCASRLPYQCPPVPFEYAFIIHEMLVARGVRDHVRLVVSSPMHTAVPVECPEALLALMSEKNIEFIPGCQPESISLDAATNRKTVKWMPHPKFNPNGTVCHVPTEPFVADVLLGTWPQQAAEVLKPLCDETGFVPTECMTLRTKYPGVYCVGDCSALTIPSSPPKPHPKAGGFAEGQARVAIRNVFSGVPWSQPAAARQDSSCRTACAMETGLISQLLLQVDLHSVEGQPLFAVTSCGPDYKEEWVESRWTKHFAQ